MKKYAMPIVVVLAVVAVVWSAFAQAQDFADFRERFQNMSEAEREELRAEMRERYGAGGRGLKREDLKKAIQAIEEQLAKFKAAVQVQRSEGEFQGLSEEERNKLRQSFSDRVAALQEIVNQVARIQSRRQPKGKDGKFMIIHTAYLKPIQEMAEKEKAEETGKLLSRLAGRGRWLVGGKRGGQESGQRPQGGTQRGQ